MAKAKTINYTEGDRAIVAALKGKDPMTLAQINEAAGTKIVPGNIVSALNKGLISKAGEVEIERDSTRPVTLYSFVTMDVQNRPNGKPFEYTDNELGILKVASTFTDYFTLDDLSSAAGRTITSGSTNNLIRKGNLAKGDKVQKPCKVKSTVSLYAFAQDIPADAQ